MSRENHTSGGSSGYRGYENQIHVTAWLALELMFPTDAAAEPVPEIQIEPDSQEDVEAQLQVPPERAVAHISARQLTIQVKYSSQEWRAFRYHPMSSSASTGTARSRVVSIRRREAPMARAMAGSVARIVRTLSGTLLIGTGNRGARTGAQAAPALPSSRSSSRPHGQHHPGTVPRPARADAPLPATNSPPARFVLPALQHPQQPLVAVGRRLQDLGRDVLERDPRELSQPVQPLRDPERSAGD